jgi:superfamily II DNA or RNA helicase
MEGCMAVLADLIRHDTPLRTGRTAVYKYRPELEKRYRFTSRFDDEVILYRVDAPVKEIHLPRALCPIGAIDERVDGEVVEFPTCAPPRPTQVKLAKDLVPIVQNRQSGIVVAPTGAGKTWIGCHIAWLAQRKTCVVMTKDDIFKQWYDAARIFLGLADSEIGIIRGDRCEVIGTKFVIAMIQIGRASCRERVS